MDEGWLAFPHGAFEKEYQIHPTLEAGWIRTRTKTGKWRYSGSSALVGAEGKPRIVRVHICGRRYLRHRLVALVKDGSAEGLAKFIDWKKNPVLHEKRRCEDERPDDSPDNVMFGSHVENNNDPNRKKPRAKSSGHPIIVKRENGDTVTFDSILSAAVFLGTDHGHLTQYLSGTNWVKNMPKCTREGVWIAVYDGIDLQDAVRIVRAAADLHLSPSRPNELFRKLPNGKFATTDNERGNGGYTSIQVVGGGSELLHRLVVETLDPIAFDTKMATNPGLGKADLQVDHIDGDESNNAIGNLVVLTRREHARKNAFSIDWVDDGWVLDTFECSVDVAETVRGMRGQLLEASNVRKVCDGVQTHTGGRVFEWADAELVEAKRASKLAKRS
jgi:hypothetical protein